MNRPSRCALDLALGQASKLARLRAGRDPALGQRRVCVVGSSTRFLSGISYYTHHVAVALDARVPVSVVLMRRLVPRFAYPGKARVGVPLSDLEYPPGMPVFDGVDWYWIPSIARALAFLRRERPTHIILQWWTGAVLHSYLALAIAGHMMGARLIIEFHEVQDTGEASLAFARWYVTAVARGLMRMAGAYVIHSEFDRSALEFNYAIGRRPVAVIPHGPFAHHDMNSAIPLREPPEDAVNLLFFGTIRPYKGLEDLVEAFEILADEGAAGYWLTVVGETWEGWTRPLEMISRSRHRDRITLVNRYVSDGEASRWFAGADAVILPYRRSSASGPLHLTMSSGLPVVVSAVGGLPAAAKDYGGAVFVPPGEPVALCRGLRQVAEMRGRRYEDPHSWVRNSEGVLALLDWA